MVVVTVSPATKNNLSSPTERQKKCPPGVQSEMRQESGRYWTVCTAVGTNRSRKQQRTGENSESCAEPGKEQLIDNGDDAERVEKES